MTSGLNDDAITGLIQSVGPDSARGLIGFFLDESRERLRRMTDLAATDALVDLTREAHSLKSAAATYGADGLAELARAVEVAGRAGDIEEINVRFQALTDHAGDHLAALEDRFAVLLEKASRHP